MSKSKGKAAEGGLDGLDETQPAENARPARVVAHSEPETPEEARRRLERSVPAIRVMVKRDGLLSRQRRRR